VSDCVDLYYNRDFCSPPALEESPTHVSTPATTSTAVNGPPSANIYASTPLPLFTPYGCGVSGVLYSTHSSLFKEIWIETRLANVSVGNIG
jgi:hypothetical protein